MFFDSTFFLLLVVILVVRAFVWRRRYRDIDLRLADLKVRVAELRVEVERLGGRSHAPMLARNVVPSVAATERALQTIHEGAVADEPTTGPEEFPVAESETTAAAPAEAAASKPWSPPWTAAASEPAPVAWIAPAPIAAQAPPRSSLIANLRARIASAGGGAELEALIGGNWLNKIGVAALVLGMGLLVRYTLAYVGPLGKVGLGAGFGLLLLLGGVLLERRTRYTLFARPLIGGGWALLYFTAYAAHNFDAARVIEDPILGLLALIAVALGMIAHSLRYRAEMVTGVAYVLAFLAIDISPLGLYSLVASGLLAASLVVLLWRFAWYRLALGAVVATYLTHTLWMLGATPTLPLPPAAFWVTEALLVVYWLTFAACDFLRKPETDRQTELLLWTTVINTFAFTALSAVLLNGAFPHSQHLLAASIGLVAVATATLLARRGRAAPYGFYGLVAGAAGTVAVFIAVREWSVAGEWLAIGWGGLAAAILAVGLRRGELLFRAEAYLVGAMAAGTTLAVAIFDVARPTIVSGGSPGLRWVTVIGAAAALFLGEWVLARLRERLAKGEETVGVVGGYAAAGLVAALVFRDAEAAYLGIVWLVVGAAAAETGLRIGYAHARYRGYALMLAGFVALMINNSNLMVSAADPLTAPWRWLVLLAAAAIFLAAGRRITTAAARLTVAEVPLAPLAYYAGALFLALLAWNELPTATVGLAWAVIALAFYETGTRLSERALRLAAYALMLAGFTSLIIVNSNLMVAAVHPLPAPWRWLVLLAAAVTFLATAWRIKSAAVRIGAAEVLIASPAIYAGALLLALLAWNELPTASVGLAWALIALAFYESGARLPERALRLASYGLAASAWGRLFLIDLVAVGAIGPISTRVLAVVPIAGLFYYFRHSIAGEASDALGKAESRLPVLFSFAATIAIFALARFEFGRSDAVVVWAALAVVLLAVGVRTRHWDYRIQAYLVALAAFARSWSTNFYLDGDFFGMPERIATTIPVILALFALGLLWRRQRRELAATTLGLIRPVAWIDAQSTRINSGLAVALTALLIFYSVSGNLLTIAWAFEGLAVTAAGFALKERTLRLSGLGLIVLCLVKGIVVDLAGIEPIFRILSFILLGAILVGISFAYTRYREVLKTYL